jgi:hypothetical protein
MPKGFFTQSAFVMLEAPVAVDSVVGLLEGCELRGKLQFHEEDASGQAVTDGIAWAGDDVLALTLAGDPRGALLVDVLAQKWPDHMGHPEAEPRLFAAFATGQFGPFVFPETLERAFEIGRAADRGLADVREKHAALLRLRATWALDAEEGQTRVVPEEYEPQRELRFVTDVAANLLEEVPGALCYFNPNGETLATAAEIERALSHADEHGLPPLEIWANLRFIELGDLPGWSLVDSIGMMQLDVPDHDAFYRRERYDPREVALFLRHAAWVSLQQGRPFGDGEVAMGPGRRRWRAYADRLAVVPAPRNVVRWIPLDGSESELPPELLEKRSLEPPGGA